MSGPDSGDGDDSRGDAGKSSRNDPDDASSDGINGSNRDTTSATDRNDAADEAARRDVTTNVTASTRNGEVAANARDGESTAPGSDSRTDGGNENDVSIEDDGLVRWFLGTNDESIVLVRDVLSSIVIVAVVGLLLFGVSGIWPPLVAVESGSMEPNMEKGDLIFVVANDRFVGENPTGDTGVVTLEEGRDHQKFGKTGDVIIFEPNGNEYQTPVIHRAHFWVEEGENWVDTKANEEYVNGASCEQLHTCPANHDGFVTKGDANDYYDQYQYGPGAQTDVVQPGWITGKATFRIPWLGYVRLTFDSVLGELVAPQPAIETMAESLENEASVQRPGVATGIGATGVAATGTGVAMAAGRFRRE